MNRHTIYKSIDLLLIRIDLIGLLVEFAAKIEPAIFMSIIPIENVYRELKIDISVHNSGGSCICVSL